MEAQRLPIGEVLPGFTLFTLPDRHVPIDAFVLIKALDEEGRPTWATRCSGGISDEELLGALAVQVDLVRRQLLRDWTSNDD